jgi:hypothetical protein
MKKYIFTVATMLFIMLFTNTIQAQENNSDYTGEAGKGRFLISSGVGFITGTGAMLAIEYGLLGNNRTGVLGIGLFGSVLWDEWTTTLSPTHKPIPRSFYSGALRTTYRYELVKTLEIYVVLWGGLIYTKDKTVYFSSGYQPFDPWRSSEPPRPPTYKEHNIRTLELQGGGYFGIRYHFSRYVGLYAEGGYGLPVISAGLSFSF